jgi:hypothetical protein
VSTVRAVVGTVPYKPRTAGASPSDEEEIKEAIQDSQLERSYVRECHD